MNKSIPEIRWQQRFYNYNKALKQLDAFVEKPDLNPLEEQGLIKAFEYTYELGWNTMRDFLRYQGEVDIPGSREAIRKSHSAGILPDGSVWMQMLADRNRTSHTYDEETAIEITQAIRALYHPAFVQFRDQMNARL